MRGCASREFHTGEARFGSGVAQEWSTGVAGARRWRNVSEMEGFRGTRRMLLEGNPPGSCGSDADRMKCSTESATLGRLRCSIEAGMPGGAPKRYGICSVGEPAGTFANEGSRRLQRSIASLSLHMISFSAPTLSVVIPRSPRLSIAAA